MGEILQRLTKVSICKQQIVEHLATRQGETEQELAALLAAAAQHPLLLDPCVQAARILPKLTPHDDIESYLQMFKNTATTEGWQQDDWAWVLAPLLTGKAQLAYFSLPVASAARYVDVKREILARVGLSPVCVAQFFFEWKSKPRLPARAQVAELLRPIRNPASGQVAECVVIDRLLHASWNPSTTLRAHRDGPRGAVG